MIGKISITVLCVLFVLQVAESVDFYVSTNGTDSGNCGTLETACATYTYANSKLSGGENGTFYVGPGSYYDYAITCQGTFCNILGSGQEVTIFVRSPGQYISGPCIRFNNLTITGSANYQMITTYSGGAIISFYGVNIRDMTISTLVNMNGPCTFEFIESTMTNINSPGGNVPMYFAGSGNANDVTNIRFIRSTLSSLSSDTTWIWMLWAGITEFLVEDSEFSLITGGGGNSLGVFQFLLGGSAQGHANIIRSNFVYNTADYGGAFRASVGDSSIVTFVVNDSTVCGNTARYMSTGLLYVQQSGGSCSFVANGGYSQRDYYAPSTPVTFNNVGQCADATITTAKLMTLTSGGLTSSQLTSADMTTNEMTTNEMTTSPLSTSPITSSELTTSQEPTYATSSSSSTTDSTTDSSSDSTSDSATDSATDGTTDSTTTTTTTTTTTSSTSSTTSSSTSDSSTSESDSTTSFLTSQPLQITTNQDPTAIDLPDTSSRNKVILPAAVGGGAALLLVVALIILLLVFKNKKSKKAQGVDTEDPIDLNAVTPKSGITQIDSKDVTIERKIGAGYFSEVFQGNWGGNPIALKKLKDANQLREFMQEARLIESMLHPNILRFLGLVIINNSDYLATEFANGGSLDKWLIKSKSTLMKQDLAAMCMQVAAGMDYLESKKVVHRDLACRNLLIQEEKDRFVVKISDFGLSRSINYNGVYTSTGHYIPIKWSALESILTETFTSKSDVWSFGVVMWEIYSFGEIPFAGLNNEEVINKLRNGDRLACPTGCPAEIYEIMKNCWQVDPNVRPTFSNLHQSLRVFAKTDDPIIVVESTSPEWPLARDNYEISPYSAIAAVPGGESDYGGMPSREHKSDHDYSKISS